MSKEISGNIVDILNQEIFPGTIWIDKGKIIEEGSHQELVNKKGFYNHLYSMQFKDPFKKDNGPEEEEFELVDVTRDTYDDKSSRFM